MYQSCLEARAGAERREVAWGVVEEVRGEKSVGGLKGAAGMVRVGFEGAAAGAPVGWAVLGVFLGGGG